MLNLFLLLRTACKVKPNSAKIKTINSNGSNVDFSSMSGNTHKSATRPTKVQNTIRNSLEKLSNSAQQPQNELFKKLEEEKNASANKHNDENSIMKSKIKNVNSENVNKIQNKEKIVNTQNKVVDNLKLLNNLTNTSGTLGSNLNTTNTSSSSNNNTTTNQNLALFFNLLKNQTWSTPSPSSPVQQQQQAGSFINFPLLSLLNQNISQFQLASLLQNHLSNNILNVRVNANNANILTSSQVNANSDEINYSSTSQFCQNQPINLSKIKEESNPAYNNETPLDLSNRKFPTEKKMQEQVHTVNSLHSSSLNLNNFSLKSNIANDLTSAF